MRAKTPKLLFFLIIFFSALPLVTAWGFKRLSDAKAPGQESQESVRERLRKQFPIVDSSESEPADAKERAKRQKRSKRYNERLAKVGPQLVETTEGYHWPADFKPIPASASDAVLVGTIAQARAHLSEDKNSVYSEFTVKISEVFKSDVGFPLNVGDSVTLERKGGRVRYSSGQISWMSVAGQGLPQLNGQYVLFLKKTDEDGLFDILTGYQIVEGRIQPLDYSPGVVGFQRYSGADAISFMNEVRSSIVTAQP